MQTIPADAADRGTIARAAGGSPDALSGTATADGGHDALAADGAIVRLRAVRPGDPGDRADLADLYRRTSDDNLYRRVIGVASYERLSDPAAAEFAVLVDDTAHGRGIGTLLLEQLAATARRQGIGDLIGDVLVGNSPMLKVARDFGPGLDIRPDSGVLEVHIRTDDEDNPALEARNRAAEKYSLTPLLAPLAIAVVGAGRTPGGIGHAVLRGLTGGGFTGPVYPVNPNAAEVAAPPAAPRRSTWSAPRAGTGSGWSGRTASASSTPTRRSGCRPRSRRPHRHLAGSRSPRSPVPSASPSSTTPPVPASACPPSSPWATRPTCPATTCSRTGTTTRTPGPSRCTWSRWATRGASPGSPARSAGASRSSRSRAGAPRPVPGSVPRTPRRRPPPTRPSGRSSPRPA